MTAATHKMTKAEHRIAIAKDVLKNLKVYKVTTGTYCHQPDIQNVELEKDTQLQKILPTIKKDCEVCALGACFLSYVNLYNEVMVSECIIAPYYSPSYMFLTKSKLVGKLRKYFSEAQLDLIEFAFEGFYGNSGLKLSDKERDATSKYYENETDDTERLRLIMKNIVKNGGEFKPTKESW